jgi:hypothetical protein
MLSLSNWILTEIVAPPIKLSIHIDSSKDKSYTWILMLHI